MHNQILNVAILHADEEKSYVDELKLHLAVLVQNGLLSAWSPCNITPGADVSAELDKAVGNAHIGLIFMSSNLWAPHNLPILDAAQRLAGRDNWSLCRVFIVHILPFDYTTSALSQLRVFPTDKIALGRHSRVDRDSKWLEITEHLRTIITERQRLCEPAMRRYNLVERFIPVHMVRDFGALSWWEVLDQKNGAELHLCSIQNITHGALTQLDSIRKVSLEQQAPVWPFDIITGHHGRTYITMTKPAKSILDCLCDCKPATMGAARVALRLARGVSLLHKHGFVLGSISPSSIFVDSRGRYYVSLLESVSTIIGRHEFLTFADVRFLAPELQGRNHSTLLTPAADVFSLGKVLLRLLDTSGPVLSRDALRGILARATSMDQRARFQDCGELAEALQALLCTHERTTSPPFVFVPGGSFQQGYQSDEVFQFPWSSSGYSVSLSSFWISQYAVTNSLYQQVMGASPSVWLGSRLPVTRVPWHDAIEFCNALSQEHGLEPAYACDNGKMTWKRDANGYRLPTEAEWEYAALGGRGWKFPWGNSAPHGFAAWNGDGHRISPCNVGSFPAGDSWCNVSDLSGNVWEWCWDIYEPYDVFAPQQYDPTGSIVPITSRTNEARILKGGAWDDTYDRRLCPAYRTFDSVWSQDGNIGFRIARNI